MDKKLVVLIAGFALSAGLVFAQEAKDAPVTDDTAANVEMNADTTAANNEEMNEDTNAAANEEAPAADAAPAAEAPAAPAKY